MKWYLPIFMFICAAIQIWAMLTTTSTFLFLWAFCFCAYSLFYGIKWTVEILNEQ